MLFHLSPAGAQNLLVNGGFDTGDFSGWTNAGATIGTLPQSGTNNARMLSATLSQTFATIPGQTYLISYFLGHTGTNTLNLGFAANFNSVPPGIPTVLQATNLVGNVPYGQQNFSVVATAATSILRFSSIGVGGGGRYILDSVSVVQQVPELNANAALVPLCLLTMFGLLVNDRRRQVVQAS